MDSQSSDNSWSQKSTRIWTPSSGDSISSTSVCDPSIFHHHGHTYIISLLTYYSHLPLCSSLLNILLSYYKYYFQNENLTVFLSCLKLFLNHWGGSELNYFHWPVFSSIGHELLRNRNITLKFILESTKVLDKKCLIKTERLFRVIVCKGLCSYLPLALSG